MCMEHVMRRVEHQGQRRPTVGKTFTHTHTNQACSLSGTAPNVQSEISLSASSRYNTHASLRIRFTGVFSGKLSYLFCLNIAML